jgi:hypothetical protein
LGKKKIKEEDREKYLAEQGIKQQGTVCGKPVFGKRPKADFLEKHRKN